MREFDGDVQQHERRMVRVDAEVPDAPPSPPDLDRQAPTPKTPPAATTPTDEPPPEPIDDPPAESEPKPPYTVKTGPANA